MASTKSKRYPLPKRFSAALSEKAYARLRGLNANYGLGNNYILTVLLEKLDDIAKPARLRQAFDGFTREYGAPKPAGDAMTRPQDKP